jgi:hypothetical protein
MRGLDYLERDPDLAKAVVAFQQNVVSVTVLRLPDDMATTFLDEVRWEVAEPDKRTEVRKLVWRKRVMGSVTLQLNEQDKIDLVCEVCEPEEVEELYHMDPMADAPTGECVIRPLFGDKVLPGKVFKQ